MDEEITEETTDKITTEEDAVSVDNSVINEIVDDTDPYADALVDDSNSEITVDGTSDSMVESATGTNDGESVARLQEA